MRRTRNRTIVNDQSSERHSHGLVTNLPNLRRKRTPSCGRRHRLPLRSLRRRRPDFRSVLPNTRRRRPHRFPVRVQPGGTRNLRRISRRQKAHPGRGFLVRNHSNYDTAPGEKRTENANSRPNSGKRDRLMGHVILFLLYCMCILLGFTVVGATTDRWLPSILVFTGLILIGFVVFTISIRNLKSP